jgi:FkbM family methyltransferase
MNPIKSFYGILAGQFTVLGAIGVKDYIRYRLSPSGSTLNVTIGNASVLIRKGTPDMSVAVASLTYEFLPLLTHLPPDYSGIIVDAGGYIGTAALALSGMFPRATIYTIEPSPLNLQILRDNVSRHKNIIVLEGALVSSKRQLTCRTLSLKDRDTGEWGFTTVESPHDKPHATATHEVRTISLRNLPVPPEQIGILKLDIEGAELEIFRDDGDLIREIPIVFAELHDRIAPGCSIEFQHINSSRNVISIGRGEKVLSVDRSSSSPT